MINKAVKRCLAAVLCGAMALPAMSCSKKGPKNPDGTPRQQYVKETDPYFTDTTAELFIPIDETRKLEGCRSFSSGIAGDSIYVTYSAGYSLSEEDQKEINGLDVYKAKELKRYFEIQNNTTVGGLAIFSMSGEMTGNFLFDSTEAPVESFVTKDGRIGIVMEVNSYEINEKKDELIQKDDYKLVFFSGTGGRLEEILLTEAAAYLGHIIDITEADNGNLLFLGDSGILVMDPSGKILSKETAEDHDSRFYCAGGKCYILTEYWETEKYTLSEVDVNTGKTGSPQLSAIAPEKIYGRGDLYFAENGIEEIVKCDFLSGTTETVLKYEYTDFTSPESVLDIRCEGEDILVLYKETSGDGPLAVDRVYLTRFHKEDKNPYAGRRLVYAAYCSDGAEEAFLSVINKYNKSPESKARIVVYEQVSEVPGLEEARADSADKLLLAMKSGNGPDVLLNCAEFTKFNSGDILLDLNPYLDGKTGIDRTKYYDNIFRAYESGGKLYQLPLNVRMKGIFGNPDLLGRPDGWTIDEMDAKLESIADKTYPTMMSPMEILEGLISVDFDHYVDFSSGKADFGSVDFLKLLEFAKKYGGKAGEDTVFGLSEKYDDITLNGGVDVLIVQAGECALTGFSADDLESFAVYKSLCSKDPLMTGWPSSGRFGLAAEVKASVGISAFSECPEEAWDFVSFLLNSEDRFSFRAGISVLRAGTDAVIADNIAEYEKFSDIYKNTDMMKNRSPLSEEMASQYRNAVESIHRPVHTDQAVLTIIKEEAQAFFAGEKSSDEVCKLIQNRVTTLLSEAK